MTIENDYEYRGLIARSWDFLRGDTSDFPDRLLFQQIIAGSGEPVLIVGCGTGRLLLEYAAKGVDVEGTDVSLEMVAICRQKAKHLSLPVTLYVQGMEEIDLPRRYQTIIVPSSAFQLVPDLLKAEKALQGFFKHLLPGGTLVMSIWHITSDRKPEWGDWWLVLNADGFEDGMSIKRWERSMYDSVTQLRHNENRYELWENGQLVYTEMHRQSPELRNYSLSQLTAMLEKAGFTGVHTLSGFSSYPASEDDEVFSIIGMRNETLSK